jgi:hypothetical protein
MPPSELRKQTLKQLRETFLRMTSPEWDLALLGKPDEVVTEAAKQLLSVQRARLRLGNVELREIRDKLVENEADLNKGRKQVAQTLKKLHKVESVLNAASAFLGVVSRVIPLL